MEQSPDFSSMTIEEIKSWEEKQILIIDNLSKERDEFYKKYQELHTHVFMLKGFQENAKKQLNEREYKTATEEFELTQDHIELLDIYTDEVLNMSHKYKTNQFIYPHEWNHPKLKKYLIEGLERRFPNSKAIKPEYHKIFDTLHMALKEIVKKEVK